MISAPALIINIVERCILCFISPEIFTAARPSPFVNKGLINKSAKGKRAMEMQWYFLMIEQKHKNGKNALREALTRNF
jgi:hypothetical protein